ncbi:MAG: hypothetical protein EOP53_16060 [Sphingobacteriales bacterium]|nr:MAG: hypothetical protein EOP53_16060 [Sphingobacteriales bacterium]
MKQEIKDSILEVFEEAKFKGNKATIHVDELTTDEIVGIGMAATDHDFQISCKRSGTGITVEMTVE